MAVTLDQIRNMIAEEGVSPSQGNIVASGGIPKFDGSTLTYVINHGWDIYASHQCDQLWGGFNYNLMAFIERQNYSDDELKRALSGLFLEDHHWDWLAKSCRYRTNEYNWFYLIIENRVEAVCLIYHPKESAFDSGDIFYVEYVAVAPWNRPNPMSQQEFRGLGTILVKHAVSFAVKKLGLRPGFSLHSLPRAEGFYTNLGMQNFPEHEKDKMKYFEMPEDKALEMVGM